MGKIIREDMLELTRRMTPARNCFHRIAGAYYDREGCLYGSFNTHFQKLSKPEAESKLKVAKTIPFSRTNVELKEHQFKPTAAQKGGIRLFLNGLLSSELKNDAMLDVFYEMFGERYHANGDYGIYFFLGNYDIPVRGSDKAEQWESEEVYRFLICAVCPIDGEYNPQPPECGFLYPAYKDRSGAVDFIDVFMEGEHQELMDILELS